VVFFDRFPYRLAPTPHLRAPCVFAPLSGRSDLPLCFTASFPVLKKPVWQVFFFFEGLRWKPILSWGFLPVWVEGP